MNYAQALEVLNRFEYSSDGFPKRYPEEADFVSALAVFQDLAPLVKDASLVADAEMTAMVMAFRPLFDAGNPIKATFERNSDNEWCLKVGGFYKHGDITITSRGDGDYAVEGRYGDLDQISDFGDLVSLNYRQWQNYKHKGFDIDSAWLPYLIEYDFVEKVETVSYKEKV